MGRSLSEGPFWGPFKGAVVYSILAMFVVLPGCVSSRHASFLGVPARRVRSAAILQLLNLHQEEAGKQRQPCEFCELFALHVEP